MKVCQLLEVIALHLGNREDFITEYGRADVCQVPTVPLPSGKVVGGIHLT